MPRVRRNTGAEQMSEATEMSSEALEQYIRGELEYPLTIAGLQSAAKRLIRERDEARARVKVLESRLTEPLEENFYLTRLLRERDEAEARGFERGIREAAMVMIAMSSPRHEEAILALLEKPLT
jgi:hypothetical protein